MCHVRQSLDAGSAGRLSHAFVTSRVDYCRPNAVLAGSLRFTTDKLQRVMNSAARVVSNTRKFDSRGYTMTSFTGMLDITDRLRFKLAVLMYRSLHGMAPPYLVNSCTVHTNRRRCWSSASAVRQSAEVDRSALSPTVSVFGVLLSRPRGPVDLHGIRYVTVLAISTESQYV